MSDTTKVTDQYELRAGQMEPLVVESLEQLDRFLEASGDLEGVRVRHRSITVTTTEWTDYARDNASTDRL